MLEYDQIRHVHLEISTKCNATCPLCPRNLFGVDIVDDYPLHDMSLAEAQAIFTPDFLQQLDELLINGNLGDFITARDGLAIVEYFRSCNPNLVILISTNASGRPNIWEPLAKLGATVMFDIDGLEDTHKLYRQYTDWNMVINNAKKFIAAGGQAHWKMIRFPHNEHQIADCEQMSRDLGFTSFELIDQGRVNGPVFDRQGNLTHLLGTPVEPQSWPELKASKDAHKEYVKADIIRFYRTKPLPETIVCESMQQSSIYVNALGYVYPCCYTGFYPGTMYHPGNEQIADLQEENNAVEFGIQHSVKWFKKFASAWLATSYESGSLHTCNNVCGR